ncbi:hypothetical protein F5X99DRAFT_426602 [Biscogniauxia marginata]|nr:hypothetical protein F5X99DRAFT_426602 [Biscogniauxia marginata]
MAVIPGLEGLKVTVLVSGTATQEHTRPEAEHSGPEDIPHSIKYIEAVPGASFNICVQKEATFEQTSHHIGFRVVIDGEECGSIEKKDSEVGDSWTKLGHALILPDEVGRLVRMDHRFGDPQNVEHPEELLSNGVNASNFGTICVYFYRMPNFEGRAVPRQIEVSPQSMGITRTSRRDANGQELSLFIQ